MPLCALPPGVPQAQAFLPRPVVDLWVSISFNVKCTESKPHLKTCIWWNSWLPRLLLPPLSHWQVLVWVLWGHFSSMMWLINQNINEHLKGMKLLTLVQITAPLYLQLEFYLFHNFSFCIQWHPAITYVFLCLCEIRKAFLWPYYCLLKSHPHSLSQSPNIWVSAVPWALCWALGINRLHSRPSQRAVKCHDMPDHFFPWINRSAKQMEKVHGMRQSILWAHQHRSSECRPCWPTA